MASLQLLLSLGIIALVSAQIPIPKREVGFVYKDGSATAPVHLDFYIDQICPDSKQALPNILKLADDYGPNTLQLTTHLFPLPYHRNSFYATKGTHIVNSQSQGQLTYTWINTVYANIDSLVNSVTLNMTDEDIINKYAMLADSIGVSASTFKDMIMNEDIEENTRIEWKYCCTRGVAATPTFMVNDIEVAADPSWTVDQWKQVIDPLLGINSKTLRFKPKFGECQGDTKPCEYLPGKMECCTTGEFCIPNVGCRC